MMKASIYKLGQVYIENQKPEEMKQPENMKKFLVDQAEEGCAIQMSYRMEYTSDILELEKQYLERKIPGKEAYRDALCVFQTAEGECRRLNLQGVPVPYAFTLTKTDGTCQIWVNEHYQEWMQLDTVFVSLLALEK